MRVLWICNIMLPVIAEKLGREFSNKEGWLAGLASVILERSKENGIELHVAYPVSQEEDGSVHRIELPEYGPDVQIYAYGFYEDVVHPERYEEGLEARIGRIIAQAAPDVIHCFGTEYGHTLAAAKCCKALETAGTGCCEDGESLIDAEAMNVGKTIPGLLIGLQGICHVAAKAYFADLPGKVIRSVTFRDWLKQDSILQQQEKFRLRGEREKEILRLAPNITGRTRFDRVSAEAVHPGVQYFPMNETLRSCFYEGQWNAENGAPHTIFVSQGDYPLKGLHYLLLAAGELQKDYSDLEIKVAGNSLVNYRTLKDKIKISAYGKYLRRLISGQRLEGKVQFLGRLSAQEMKEQYLKSGLYVCCSSNENSPNSLGEAMLLGVPCVAANVGGIPSIFSHGEDGLLYEGFRLQKAESTEIATECNVEKASNLLRIGDGRKCVGDSKEGDAQLHRVAKNLELAIRQMWEHPEEIVGYTKNARSHAEKTHDREANYRRLTEIYKEIAVQSDSTKMS